MNVMSPVIKRHFDQYRHRPHRFARKDKLAIRAEEATFLKSQGEKCPMSWFANSPLYWNLLLVDSDYQPPYLRPAIPAQGSLFQ